ncbi:MAG: hypothetical protein M3P18_22705 [Actinomycetota bacterium]|nr:hypothetical protein [Actinomycetota bacterium]
MNVPTTKLTFTRRAWWVPSEGRAFEGWLEGRPTAAQRDDAVARVRRQRAAWKPDAQAWEQLIQLQVFVGRRVKIQFWCGSMWLLAEEEWPVAIEAHCEGVVTLIDQGHLQGFLLLPDLNPRTDEFCRFPYLVEQYLVNGLLAPVAEIYEIETIAEAA